MINDDEMKIVVNVAIARDDGRTSYAVWKSTKDCTDVEAAELAIAEISEQFGYDPSKITVKDILR